ncbi:aldehyde dehydrogenase [Ramaria rubella]|nr:aldehyde dehydrogenase [Ramaria rubella]
MPTTFTHSFDNHYFKGKTSFSTGLFINNEFVDGSDNTTIDIFNPTTGKKLTAISEGTAKDVDLAVAAAQKAYDTTWGLNMPGFERGKLLIRWAELIEEHIDEISAIESLDNGKIFPDAKGFDVTESAAVLRYYGGWADKNHGKVIETKDSKLGYTRHEPFGVVGQIIPWNFPLLMFSWKVGPALATGNTIVLKPSEITPLSALRVVALSKEAGFPPGVINIVTGYGKTVGNAISSHPAIEKVAFTGSTLVGREIMRQAAASNLKNITLELGGKSPNIIFDDADIDAAIKWASHGIYFNHGQTCCAGSRVYVQASIFDTFQKKFLAYIDELKLGHPLEHGTGQGPQVSQAQFDRIMGYIEDGKKAGAKAIIGGERHGTEGYFIQPTIFTDTTPDMRIVREEIFGPVGVLVKFEDEDDIVRVANDTLYGLAAAVFSNNLSRALRTAHRLKAGTVWVNCVNKIHPQLPFGGFKQSGIGRELGEYALANYTSVKCVHVDLTGAL